MFAAPLLFLVASLVAVPTQDKKDDKPQTDTKRVDAAVTEIEAAFKDGKTEERVAAIKKNFAVTDARVVAAVGKGLKDKDATVQSAAVDALGRMPHPDALDALHKFYKSEIKRLRDDQTLMPLVIKSIGRQGSESSVDILSDDLFMQRTFPAIQARVFSLGNIRSKRSVQAIFDMMNKAGTNQVDKYAELFRQSLWRLTGTDQGPSCQMWMTWWRDNKDKFDVAKDVPKMSSDLDKSWNDYWEIQPKKEAPKEGDGEKKGG